MIEPNNFKKSFVEVANTYKILELGVVVKIPLLNSKSTKFLKQAGFYCSQFSRSLLALCFHRAVERSQNLVGAKSNFQHFQGECFCQNLEGCDRTPSPAPQVPTAPVLMEGVVKLFVFLAQVFKAGELHFVYPTHQLMTLFAIQGGSKV